MTFVHVSLLAGMAFVSVPVMLHLLGRREPKKITFPALRFVRQTAIQAQRGWSIKRWLLLALRMLLLSLAALALAAPRVHSAMHATYLSLGLVAVLAVLATAAGLLSYASRHPKSVWLSIAGLAILLWGGFGAWLGYAVLRGEAAPSQAASGPICAAIVIDTGPTMDYRHANASRLDVAKETARWLMDRLPSDSQIAVVTSAQGQRLHPSRVSANRQLENVKLEGRSSDLPNRIQAAIEVVRNSKIERREVYVLTDLSANAWSSAESSIVSELLKPKPDQSPVLVQVIDLGTAKRENWTLSGLKLSQDVVAPEGAVELRAVVTASPDTPGGQLAVELLVEKRDARLPVIRNGEVVLPKAEIKDRINVDVPSGGKADVRFNLRDIESGTTHAMLRLSRPDPLAIDNELPLTIEAQASEKLLVLGELDEAGENRASVAAKMLDPKLEQVAVHAYRDLTTLGLNDFDAILMIEPPVLEDTVVARLQAAVDSGKGLMLVMGRGAANEQEWSGSATTKLLPGKVGRLWRRPLTDDSHFFVSLKPNHPVWNIFGQTATAVPWNAYPVFKYWMLDNLSEDATVLMRYAGSGHPAVVEQPRGAGRIVTVTTPMTDPDLPDSPPWNRLWASNDPWPNFGLLVGAMRYLSQNGNAKRNFTIGTPPSIENPIDKYPTRYDLYSPSGEVVRVQAQGNAVGYAYAQQLGTYRLRSVQADRGALRGFSVQLDPRSVGLDRIDPAKLDAVLGPNQYFLVRDRDKLQSSIGQARYGKDLAPFLLVVLFFVVVAEQAMSYRFYHIGARGTR